MARQDFAQSGEMWPRWVNVVLGVWLFISAFVWPHFEAVFTNTWIVGVLITAVAIWSMFMPAARWINAVLAVWLFFSSLFMLHTAGTGWNNAIVAIIVFVMALIPSGVAHMRGSTQRPLGPPATHAPV